MTLHSFDELTVNSYNVVALVESRRAGKVLREGPPGTPAAHATLPRLERARQLRLWHQEEEKKERTNTRRAGRYLEQIYATCHKLYSNVNDGPAQMLQKCNGAARNSHLSINNVLRFDFCNICVVVHASIFTNQGNVCAVSR